MPKTKINDIEMYYEVHGPTCLPAAQADPLLLIMGLGANATSWEMQLPAFGREYRVVAFDNRGSGRTDKPKSPYTMPQMADDAAAPELAISSGYSATFLMGVSNATPDRVASTDRGAAGYRSLTIRWQSSRRH